VWSGSSPHRAPGSSITLPFPTTPDFAEADSRARSRERRLGRRARSAHHREGRGSMAGLLPPGPPRACAPDSADTARSHRGASQRHRPAPWRRSRDALRFHAVGGHPILMTPTSRKRAARGQTRDRRPRPGERHCRSDRRAPCRAIRAGHRRDQGGRARVEHELRPGRRRCRRWGTTTRSQPPRARTRSSAAPGSAIRKRSTCW
jgi:hypothetical protein